MRVLILSDSHRNKLNVKKILEEEKNCEALIFCGDGEEDIPNGLNMKVIKVRGNNDWRSNLPAVETFFIGETKFMVAHGHTFFVKRSLDDIIFTAKQAKAQVLCFGHTHIQYKGYEDGLHIVNPGSCMAYLEYAVVEIKDKSILISLLNIKKK